MFKTKFVKGQEVTNQEMSSEFRCGNMGRIRPSKITKTLVLLTYEHKGCYIDEIKDGIIYYTGQGKRGDQTLDKRNDKLYNYEENELSVHLFRVSKANNYIYEGEMVLAQKPYQDIQKDDDKMERQVWIFPLKLKNEK